MPGIFLWLPRVLAIGFVLFVSVFALDVFGKYRGWDVVPALLIHLIPSLFLAATVVIAWKRELVGAVVFLGIAVLYIWAVGFGRPWSWYAAISFPSAVVGALFIISFLIKKKLRG